MNLLRNVRELPRGVRLVKSLKRAEEYLFSVKELDGTAKPQSHESQPAVPSFKSLFQEEAKLLPSYLSKLNVASHHPVMGVARDFYGQNPSMPSLTPALQLRAIFVLLIAKSIQLRQPPAKNSEATDEEYRLLVDSKQKALAQITELLFAGHVLHRSVVNVSNKDPVANSGLHAGNKLAALIGDLLLAKTSRRLSDLKNHIVTELMSNTICEFSQSGFIGEEVTTMVSLDAEIDAKVLPTAARVPRLPHLTYQNWVERSKQSLGAIVGNSCISCMILAEQEDEGLKRFVSDLGRCVGICLQAYRDITLFEGEDGIKPEVPEFIDPWTLPVVIEAEQNTNLIFGENDDLDYVKVFETIQSSQRAMQKSKHVLGNFQQRTIDFLDELQPSEPVAILLDIIASMRMKTT